MPTTSAAARDRRVRGRALRELRQRADITPEELAARVGTDDAYVSRVETGRLDGPLAYLAATLRALDASVVDLSTEIDGQPSTS